MAKKRTMALARRRFSRPAKHQRRKFELPLAVVAGCSVPVVKVWNARAGGIGGQYGMMTEASRIMLGYNPNTSGWSFNDMKFGLLPVVLGFAIHKFVGGTLGINRMLAAARIPVVRL